MALELVGYRIRERRKQIGITQAGLAKSVGISPSYLNLIEASKRNIAGGLLNRIAAALDLEVETLAGTTERRVIDDLNEMAVDPRLKNVRVPDAGGEDLVARHLDWAQAMLALYRAYVDQAEAVAALSDRLSRDPFLGDMIHQVLTHITTLRSVSEILEGEEDMPAEQQRRFQGMMSEESAKLADMAQALTGFFEVSESDTRSVTPAEEVDDFLIDRRNHFPAVEAAAAELRRAVERQGETIMSALIDHLDRRHGVVVESQGRALTDAAADRFRNHARFDADARRLIFLDNAAISTRRFQLARVAAELDLREVIAGEVDDPRLASDAARHQAFRVVSSYAASAMLLPYDDFLADAIACRYDIEVLRQRYTASFEQVAHRLITLKRKGAEGIPFAFLRSNPAGHATKRFPLPGLPLPRYGHACPLWAVYQAFQTPDRVVRQLAELPDRGRFLFVARTVTKQPATFHEPPVLHSVMLACESVHADQTVYADGLDLSAHEMAARVGPSCRLCPRLDCLHREEEPIVRAAEV
jgi:predicted transcriptional regulator/transcriptional regulator with XRE-family HTH domain